MKYKYQELAEEILGAAMEVHQLSGNGFQEVIYQRAPVIVFEMRNIEYEREKEMPLLYKGYDIGTRRVDSFTAEKITLDIKTVAPLENVHLAQTINYLETYDFETGLLINFGNSLLQFKQVMKPNKNHSPSGNQIKS